MNEQRYREIVEECIEFGWLNQYQDQEFREIEREVLLPGLEELRDAQQVLASVFLQREYLEPGVALAPSPLPWPVHEANAELPEPLASSFDAAEANRGHFLLVQSAEPAERRRAAAAAAAAAAARGWLVLRAVGRTVEDGRRDPVLEPLITQALLALGEAARAELCVKRGQYLQLMAPLTYFPVRPGGVFNTDPGLNRTKLNGALLELLLRLADTTGVCVLAEEAQLFPGLAREALGYLAWTLKNGNMGLSGLGVEDRPLNESRVLVLVTAAPHATEQEREWVERLEKRRVRRVDLDRSRGEA
jgi:hypothetical protein